MWAYLAPTLEVLRELYLKSGNQCAYPSCTHVMINSEGGFIGEICHIEAALPGGERFNSNQTNEDRRAYANLLLMCHAHHKITDDVERYPVAELREIKREHEAQFSDIAGVILGSITDYTFHHEVSEEHSLKRLNSDLGWELSQDELKESCNRSALSDQFCAITGEVWGQVLH